MNVRLYNSNALRVIALVVAGWSLTGCVGTAPDSRMDEVAVDVPKAWSESREAQRGVDQDWIARFGDKQLQALVKDAERANPDLRAAAARVMVAEKQAVAAGAGRRPLANLTVDGNRAKRNFIGFPIGGPGAGVATQTSNVFGLSFDVQWELDVWGRIRAGESAAVARAEAAAADYQAARVSLAAQVAKTYFGILEARMQVRTSREALEILKDTEEVVRQRFRSGQGDPGNVGGQLRLAMSDVEAAKADLAESEQRLEVLSRQLESLLGNYPNKRVLGDRDLPELKAVPPAGLPSELLQRRPDVLAAERRFAASGKSVSEAKRAIFPQIRLTGAGGTSTDVLNQLLNSDFGVWNLAGGIVQPILAGGQIRAAYDERLAREQEALAGLQRTVLDAFLEVENALANERWLRRREEATTRAFELAYEADQEARRAFRDGVGSILAVFESQRRMIGERRRQTAVRLLRLQNRIDLHLALGGDY
ncbi:efflux transporter outer membrane subunit [Sulfuriroseicoccus oceanibius]|uniref:Efflux transporter outer membrane subunit n=1 Tax=Sulfuriroseicoccus oceanibius TaxID=2707525 RepID=A0A6B3LAN2_9BACT|nr:efflux transporter outer membrane subunit [Sulfuriroseicoccus oceanibius]QQL43907.1 efflux transporter outer membrane subunit [Sulfuriroseicoccus oceanibius]